MFGDIQTKGNTYIQRYKWQQYLWINQGITKIPVSEQAFFSSLETQLPQRQRQVRGRTKWQVHRKECELSLSFQLLTEGFSSVRDGGLHKHPSSAPANLSALTLVSANLTGEGTFNRSAMMSQKYVFAYLAALHTDIREVYNLEEE